MRLRASLWRQGKLIVTSNSCGTPVKKREVGMPYEKSRVSTDYFLVLQLISRHYTPEDQIRASVTPPDSPTTSQIIYVQISLQKELRPCPVPKIHFFENDVTNPHTIKLSPRPDVNSKIRASNYSLLSYLSGTVEFPSPYALVPQSTFLVYLDDNITPIHSEVAPLKCLSSLQPYGWQYSSEIAPDFWDTLCFSPGRFILSYPSLFCQLDYIDSMRYTILQYLKIIESYQTVFIIYRFDSHPPFGPVPILGPSISWVHTTIDAAIVGLFSVGLCQRRKALITSYANVPAGNSLSRVNPQMFNLR